MRIPFLTKWLLQVFKTNFLEQLQAADNESYRSN